MVCSCFVIADNLYTCYKKNAPSSTSGVHVSIRSMFSSFSLCVPSTFFIISIHTLVTSLFYPYTLAVSLFLVISFLRHSIVWLSLLNSFSFFSIRILLVLLLTACIFQYGFLFLKYPAKMCVFVLFGPCFRRFDLCSKPFIGRMNRRKKSLYSKWWDNIIMALFEYAPWTTLLQQKLCWTGSFF